MNHRSNGKERIANVTLDVKRPSVSQNIGYSDAADGGTDLITLAAQMMDSLMLGRLGQIELSASSLANQPFFIFNLLIFGMASGSSVLNATVLGKAGCPVDQNCYLHLPESCTDGQYSIGGGGHAVP